MDEGKFKKLVEDLKNDRITELCLERDYFYSEQDSVFWEALANNASVTTLILTEMSIDFKALAKMLPNNSHLQTLELRRNNIDKTQAEMLGTALLQNTTLKTFVFYHNRYESSTQVLVPFLMRSALETVKLQISHIDATCAKVLAEGLSENTTLKVLDLYGNHLRVESMTAVAKALYENNTLQTLILDSCDIKDEGAEALGKALEHNAGLTMLSLSNNEIEAKGAKALAKGLCKNTTLLTVELYRNKAGNEGAAAFSETLNESDTLVELLLNDNDIHDEGAKALAEGIRRNKTLLTLSLYNNFIRDEGANALIEALSQHNTTLLSLPLGRNAVNVDKEIGKYLDRNEQYQKKIQFRTEANTARLALLTAFSKASQDTPFGDSVLPETIFNSILQKAGFAPPDNSEQESGRFYPIDESMGMLSYRQLVESSVYMAELAAATSNRRLLEGAKKGDLGKVAEALVVPGVDINTKEPSTRSTALQLAVRSNHATRFTIIKALFLSPVSKIQLGYRDSSGKTALEMAEGKENAEIKRFLNYAPSNCKLHKGAETGRLHLIEQALKEGADVNSVQAGGYTVLQRALLSQTPGTVAVVRRLLKETDLTLEYLNDEQSLSHLRTFLAGLKGLSENNINDLYELIQQTIEVRAKLTMAAQRVEVNKHLLEAVAAGSLKDVRGMLASDADINARSSSTHSTALQVAVLSNHENRTRMIIDLLLRPEIQLGYQDDTGKTALEMARGNSYITKLLNDAPMNRILHQGAEWGLVELVRYALKQGANVNSVSQGYNALQLALLSKRAGPKSADVIRRLLQEEDLNLECVDTEQKLSTLLSRSKLAENEKKEVGELIRKALVRQGPIITVEEDDNQSEPSDVKLQVENTEFQHAERKYFSEALNKDLTVQTLDLSNRTGSEAITAALKALQDENTPLEVLNLSNCNLSVKDARALAEAIRQHPTLKKLILRNNNISGEGAEAIAKALYQNDVLQELDLCNTRISDKGAKALAKYLLLHHPALEILRLDGNTIGDEGALALAKALRESPEYSPLRTLHLANNFIGDEGLKALVEALCDKNNLEHLHLSGNTSQHSRFLLFRSIVRQAELVPTEPDPTQSTQVPMLSFSKFKDSKSQKIEPIVTEANKRLLQSSEKGDFNSVLKALSVPGINVNALDPLSHSTPLQLAVLSNHPDHISIISILLLQSGIALGHKNNDGKTALDIAMAKGDKEIVKLLNAAPSNLALLDGVVKGMVSLVDYALQEGADVNASRHHNVLESAILSGKSETIEDIVRRLLLEPDLNLDCVDNPQKLSALLSRSKLAEEEKKKVDALITTELKRRREKPTYRFYPE